MSASGFTWCYLIILGAFGGSIPFEHEDGTVAPLLTPDAIQAFADLGYLVIIFPILGSGIAITVHSWGVFWRKRNFTNGAVAGWNSFAQVYNVVSALEHVPKAFGGVSDYFGSKDSKGSGKAAVLVLVSLAVIGGVLTTWWIIKSTMRSTAYNRRFAYEASMPIEDRGEKGMSLDDLSSRDRIPNNVYAYPGNKTKRFR